MKNQSYTEEDLIELGWVVDSDEDDYLFGCINMIINGKRELVTLFHLSEDGDTYIKVRTKLSEIKKYDGVERKLFEGYIANKEELKKLMEKLNTI